MSIRLLPFTVVALLLFLSPVKLRAQDIPPTDRAKIAQRMFDIEPEEANGTVLVVKDLLDVDPDIGFQVLKETWPKLRVREAKSVLVNTFLASANPHMIEIIQLAATDPDLNIQNFALRAAESIAFQTFAEDYGQYLEWNKQNTSKKLLDVLKESIRDFVGRMSRVGEAEKENYLLQLLNKNVSSLTRIAKARRQYLLEAKVIDTLGIWLKDDANPNLTQLGFQVIRALKPEEEYARRALLPLIQKDMSPNVRAQAISMLAGPEHKWAVDTLLKMLVEEYPDPLTFTIGQSLSMIGDPRILPTIIGMLEVDNSREGAMTLGNILASFTAVFVNDQHDAAWWKDWMNKNRLRLPAEVRNAPIPKLTLKKRPAPQAAEAAPPRAELRQIAGDPTRAYWIISPQNMGRFAGRFRGGGGIRQGGRFFINGVEQQPAVLEGPVKGGVRPAANTSPGLIVVLDSMGNGANAVPFWSDVVNNALKGKYYVALPVSPRWSPNQPAAWVTNGNKKLVKEARFTTEAFVADIVKDASTAYGLDANRVYLHGVADSGPVVYACALEPTTPFKGFYVLASNFKSGQLPSLKTAKGRRFLIQHSKDDKESPFLMAMAAEKVLKEQGAVVKLSPYKGKHGYVFEDDIWKEMSAAITWLEEGK